MIGRLDGLHWMEYLLLRRLCSMERLCRTQPTDYPIPTTPNRRMMGGAAQNFEENERFFRLHGLGPAPRPGSDKALDLGCGCVGL